MIPQLPWWHRLLKPWFNWRADVREKKEAARRLKEHRTTTWEHQGYFNWRNIHVASAQVSNKGARRLDWLTAPKANVEDDLVVAAWLRGLPIDKTFLWSRPNMTDAEIKAARERDKENGEKK